MDKLPPWSRRFARAASAALLALVLVLQLVAGAASARAAVGAEVVAETGHCGDGPGPARERQGLCFCCIASRSILLDALAGLPANSAPDAIALIPALRILRLDLDRRATAASLLGWTSSWSQRAPPRLAASPLRLEG